MAGDKKKCPRATKSDLERAVLYGTGADEGHDDRHNVDGQLELEKLGDGVVHVAAPHDGLEKEEEDDDGGVGNYNWGK